MFPADDDYAKYQHNSENCQIILLSISQPQDLSKFGLISLKINPPQIVHINYKKTKGGAEKTV